VPATTWRSDLFGEAPLYFAPNAGGLAVGSSARAVALRAGLTLRLDRVAAMARLLGCLAAERSLFEGIGRVPPGHTLEGAAAGWMLRQRWQPPLVGVTAEAQPWTPAELLEALRGAFRSTLTPAVDGRGRAVALSGGLDSATLLALAAEQGPVRTYALIAGFTDPAERVRAHEVAHRYGAVHKEVQLRDEELPAAFPRAVLACEDTLWNGAAAAKLLFFEVLAAQRETEVLSGAGADEVLCGNPAGLLGSVARLAAERAVAQTLVDPEALPERVSDPPAPSRTPSLIELQDRALRETLPESTLPPECRTATRAGLRVRLPFLDLAFAERALRVPPEQRVRDGRGKWLLREATARLLPDAIRLVRKVPRLAPALGSPALARGAWQAFGEEWLAPGRLHALGFVRPGAVASLWDRLGRGTCDARQGEAASAVLLRLASLTILDAHAREEQDRGAGRSGSGA
jgi:asparagine synthase (glutamine-hydrolysing)